MQSHRALVETAPLRLQPCISFWSLHVLIGCSIPRFWRLIKVEDSTHPGPSPRLHHDLWLQTSECKFNPSPEEDSLGACSWREGSMKPRPTEEQGWNVSCGSRPVPSCWAGLSGLPTLTARCRPGLFTASTMKQRTQKPQRRGSKRAIHPLLATWGLCVLTLGGGCHCGGRLEAPLPLLHVLLWVEQDDVGLGYVEHAEGHWCAQA